MKAVVYRRYGPPDVLRVEDVEKPVPKGDEVLVWVHAASVNAADRVLLRGKPFMIRLGMGLSKPKHPILGFDVAGRVEAVGRRVEAFRPGDDVFGASKFGGFAEYACVSERTLVPKPPNVSFEQAAATPTAAYAALQAIRKRDRLRPGGTARDREDQARHRVDVFAERSPRCNSPTRERACAREDRDRDMTRFSREALFPAFDETVQLA